MPPALPPIIAIGSGTLFTGIANLAKSIAQKVGKSAQSVAGIVSGDAADIARALGLLKDNTKVLLSAYNYLLAHLKSDKLLETPEEDNQLPSSLKALK